MDLYVDLLEKKKISIFHFVLGSFFLLFGIVKLLDFSQMGIVDWMVCITYILLSIYSIFYGFGFSIERFFGKAYISIDKEIFAIKQNVFKKEQCIRWTDVKSITYKLNKIEIQSTSNERKTFNLSDLPFQIKQQMKKSISCIAKEKDIETNSI